MNPDVTQEEREDREPRVRAGSPGEDAAPPRPPWLDAVAERIRGHLATRREEMTRSLLRLVSTESPSTVPGAQEEVQRMLARFLRKTGFHVRHIPGHGTGGHLYGRPLAGAGGRPLQLLIGHSDTVWPLGTVESMPAVIDGETLRGPGSFDMKGGLVIVLYALRTLRDLDLEPSLAPVVLITSDEELGSGDSARYVRMLARRSARAFILEPALGLDGRIKTRRKGIAHFEIQVVGKSAHGGLEPEAGASAIRELSHVIRKLYALADPSNGVTVNVGMIEGGVRPNVVAPTSRAVVDCRVPTARLGWELERTVHALEPEIPGTRLRIEGGLGRLPLEPTLRNRRLWGACRAAGEALGMELQEGISGGGSDGNITSQYTATLDGLGPVGDGAHADHEFVYLDSLPERAALLATLLMWPRIPDPVEPREAAPEPS